MPVIHFDDILNNISQSAENIDSRSIQVKDVTEDYQDAQIRIKNKKEIENRYRELLNKAQKVPEILSIEEKLGEIRTDIEAFEVILIILTTKSLTVLYIYHFTRKLENHMVFHLNLSTVCLMVGANSQMQF